MAGSKWGRRWSGPMGNRPNSGLLPCLIWGAIWAVALAALPIGAAWAQDSGGGDVSESAVSPLIWSGSASLATQYRFRGMGNTGGEPVAQAGIAVDHASGFYAGLWGATRAAGHGAASIGGPELNIYAGYLKPLGDSGVSLDGGIYGYIFPEDGPRNFYEAYGAVSKAIGPLMLKAGGNWAPQGGSFRGRSGAFGAKRSNLYLFVDANSGLPFWRGAELHGRIGRGAGGFYAAGPVWDYALGGAYRVKAVTFDVSLVGTSLSRAQAARPEYALRATRPAGVFTLTASF